MTARTGTVGDATRAAALAGLLRDTPRCPACGETLAPERAGESLRLRCDACGTEAALQFVRTAAPDPGAEPPDEVRRAARDSVNLFGRFVLLRSVARGGFSVIWRAWQSDLRRFVALKFLQCDEIARFIREAQIAAKLRHPNIVPIHEVGEHGGRHYLVMEYIEGETLNRLRLAPDRAVDLIREAAEAIHFAHGRGIVHRDLKPQNIMLDRAGRVWVMDFGVARQLGEGASLTGCGVVLGTPAYMPPEQARGFACDSRSDIYSLGATLYALLAGRAPFQGRTPVDVLALVAAQPAPPLGRLNPRVDAALEAVVAKAMDRDPDGRYASAQAFADDLRRWQEGAPVAAAPAETGEWTSRDAVRHHVQRFRRLRTELAVARDPGDAARLEADIAAEWRELELILTPPRFVLRRASDGALALWLSDRVLVPVRPATLARLGIQPGARVPARMALVAIEDALHQAAREASDARGRVEKLRRIASLAESLLNVDSGTAVA